MKNFVYIYHSTQTTPPTQASLDAFGAWYAALGDKVVDGGNPIKKGSSMIVKNGQVKPANDSVIGYAIIKANSMDEAVEMVISNPLAHANDGAVHVYETTEM
jgi:hypothetical protein